MIYESNPKDQLPRPPSTQPPSFEGLAVVSRAEDHRELHGRIRHNGGTFHLKTTDKPDVINNHRNRADAHTGGFPPGWSGLMISDQVVCHGTFVSADRASVPRGR
jgi:hypothetical protein